MSKFKNLNIATKDNPMVLTPLNETSDKVMMDALVVFKSDDYCPVFDDDFNPEKHAPFIGEVSTNPSGFSEIYVCEEFFPDELAEKLYNMGYGNGIEPNWQAEQAAALDVLDDIGYEFKPIFGLPTDKTLHNGRPQIEYSLSQSNDAKVYGFALIEQSASMDYAKIFVDKENGKDIAFHAVKIYHKDEVPNQTPFLPTDNDEIKDNQVFGFLDNNGVFVPESELNHEFDVASMLDLKQQVEAGKDFAHLPAVVKDSPSLCMIVVANNPSDLSASPQMNGLEHRKSTFIDGVVSKMARREKNETLKEDSLKLLKEIEKTFPNKLSSTAGKLIKTNCIGIKDLPDKLMQDPNVYLEVVQDNSELINKGLKGDLRLSDIPKDMLCHHRVVNAIADQMGVQKDTFNTQKTVDFKNLPEELQKHPIIIGREAVQNLPMLSVLPKDLKNNPEFLSSFFKFLKKEQMPEMFNRLYGGIENAPFIAKTFATSVIHLRQEDARAILDATYGKERAQRMMIDAQKSEFGKERGFAPNLTEEGYRHLLSADITMNAAGEVMALKFNFDNGYIDPDGDHNGWQSVRSQIINPSNYFKDRGELYETRAIITTPMIGHEQAKKDIGLALGGAKPKTMWTPIEKTEMPREYDKSKNLIMDSDEKSMRG